MQCLSCGKNALNVFLDLGMQPLANKYPRAEEFLRERRVPLKAAFCSECELVQLTSDCLVSREDLFQDYYYLSSVNQGLVQHFVQLAKLISAKKPRLVVDIGSNDGVLLKPLNKAGVRAVGIEPAANIAQEANAKGLQTMNRFWDVKTALAVEEEHGKADVIVASNIFTHILDPKEFLSAVDGLLSESGELIVEVEYLPEIVESLGFERFYSDHTFYFTLSSLSKLVNRYGLTVYDAESIPTHGGSLRAYIRRIGARKDTDRLRDRFSEESIKGYGHLQTYEKFSNDVRSAANDLRSQLEEYVRREVRVAGYGAPARLSTITNFADIGPNLVRYVVDDSPLKQGRFSPGMHIPILGKDTLRQQPVDLLVVFAWNYLDDIKAKLGALMPRPELMIPIPPEKVSW